MKENKIFSPEFWENEWNLLNSKKNVFFGYTSPTTWNTMAEKYGCNQEGKKRSEEIEKTIYILESNGVRLKNSKVLDIGCGPGYFARAFCEKGADVICIDISEKMLERLQKEIPKQLMKKIQIFHADWKLLDVKKEGFAERFDLVFANMTPAITTPESFKKIMKVSKKWCWFKGWAGLRRNLLMERVSKVIYNKEPSPFYGNFTYAWNLICSMGYFPYTIFNLVNWTEKKSIGEWVNFYSIFFKKSEYNKKIRDALSKIAIDGYVENSVSGYVGAMLWAIEK
ncbi:MAG: class I SAM-dependent methyltransferase [Chitinispirillaceae bacterium]|nr:class I SAM-dependent methyltransferase [Chitinispirillaceae bacterium]